MLGPWHGMWGSIICLMETARGSPGVCPPPPPSAAYGALALAANDQHGGAPNDAARPRRVVDPRSRRSYRTIASKCAPPSPRALA